MAIDAIRLDPEWKNGNYTSQPPGLNSALNIRLIMTGSPLELQRLHPTRVSANAFIERTARARFSATDANDFLYQLDASADYDPSPQLERIKTPLIAVNSDDDLINPPQLPILEREIVCVPRGRAIVLPITDETRGHGTHSIASYGSAT